MSPKKDNLDKQLERARTDLASRAKVLEAKGIKGKDRRRDPQWRHLSALCASIKSRLEVIQASRNLNDELKQRKADKAAQAAAEAAAPKAKAKKEGKKEQKPPKEKSKKKPEKAAAAE